MVINGHIENGNVVLDEPTDLPNGTPVRVEVIARTLEPSTSPKSLLDRLGSVVGAIDDLPEDAATNIDHYLYGHPKK